MKGVLFIFFALFSGTILPQERLTLQQCHELAKVNFPLAQQLHWLDAQSQLEQEIIEKSRLPQLNFEAQATYQSEVTEVPIANMGIDPPNKDQYRATLSANQLIYNGGATYASSLVKSAQFKAKQKQVEVNLYQLKKTINQLYFSILLTTETFELLQNKENLLLTKLSEVKSGINNGVLLPSSDQVLDAELLKLKQQFTETESNKAVLIESLSQIIGRPLDNAVIFEYPLTKTGAPILLARPELDLFQLQKEEIERNEALLATKNTPKIVGFATGGYGNPGLNLLDNSFQLFYIVGLKLNWNVLDWNASKKQRQSLAIHKNIIDTETETFRLNTSIELHKQQQEIDKIKAFVNSDKAVIALRKQVLKTADSQLKNGVITASAYLTELTKLYEDENTLIMHEIQLQLAKANYNVVSGQ